MGNPEQLVYVLPSTSSTTTWAVADQGCPAGVNLTDCEADRGGNFNINASTTWLDKGLMNLGVDVNLGFGDDGGDYGLDQRMSLDLWTSMLC